MTWMFCELLQGIKEAAIFERDTHLMNEHTHTHLISERTHTHT